MTRQKFDISIREIVLSFWRNRALVLTLTRREIAGRYRGSFLGALWSFFNPVFMLAVYTLVFGNVLKTRWNTTGGSQAEFSLILFVGLMVFDVFADCVNRAPIMVVTNVNYVKRVVFPLEVLPWVSIGTALFHMAVSLAVWFIFYVWAVGLPTLTLLLLPLVLLPLILLTVGISWILMSLGVYMRDIAQVVPIITSMMMFLSPIFYPVSALPEKYRTVLLLNPITVIVEQAREVLIWGRQPDWWMLLLYCTIATGVAWVGFAWFQKTRKGFADVL